MFDYATLYWIVADHADWIIPAGIGASVALAVVPRRGPILPPPPDMITHDGIRVNGSSSFISKTTQALNALRGLPSYERYVKNLEEIREGPPLESVGGYCMGRTFVTTPSRVDSGTQTYALAMVHEGAHARREGINSDLTEEERIAFRAEREAAHEANWSPRVSAYQAENPTHHIAWYKSHGIDVQATGQSGQSSKEEPAQSLRIEAKTFGEALQASGEAATEEYPFGRNHDEWLRIKRRKKEARWAAEGYKEFQTSFQTTASTPSTANPVHDLDRARHLEGEKSVSGAWSYDVWRREERAEREAQWRAKGWIS